MKVIKSDNSDAIKNLVAPTFLVCLHEKVRHTNATNAKS